jgi:hypothetical protein
MLRKELATRTTGAADLGAASEEVIYKIDIPANRYDMLCLEGIARSLNIFRQRETPPLYRLADMAGVLSGGRRVPHHLARLAAGKPLQAGPRLLPATASSCHHRFSFNKQQLAACC